MSNFLFEERDFSYLELFYRSQGDGPSETWKRGFREKLRSLARAVLRELSEILDGWEFKVWFRRGRAGFFLDNPTHRTKSGIAGNKPILFFLLYPDRAQIGFCLYGKESSSEDSPLLKFRKNINRFFRKSEKYYRELRKKDYLFWKDCTREPTDHSMDWDEWREAGRAVGKLLTPAQILSVGTELPSVVAQLFSELLGWYGFIERKFSKLPPIRELHIPYPEESDWNGGGPELDDRALRLTWVDDFLVFSRNYNFIWPRELISALYLSLQTRPFAILSGPVGVGKSSLALLFVRFVCEELGDSNYTVIPVRSDWTDSLPLLGYYDVLAGVYRPTPFLRILLRALEDPENPYFVILEELNLSRPEYYLSEILILLESSLGGREERVPLTLHQESSPLAIEDPVFGSLSVPPSLSLPPNLYLIGTINEDETTYSLSPKVLDRANVIAVSPGSAEYFLQLWSESVPCSEKKSRSVSQIALQRSIFIREGDFSRPYSPWELLMPAELRRDLGEQVGALLRLFSRLGVDFSSRWIGEFFSFAENAFRFFEPELPDVDWILERVIFQRLLPQVERNLKDSRQLLEWLILFSINYREFQNQLKIREKENNLERPGLPAEWRTIRECRMLQLRDRLAKIYLKSSEFDYYLGDRL